MKVIITEDCTRCIHRGAGWRQLGLVGFLFVITAVVGIAYADDPEFTNDTMETRVTSPPPNIMFVLDNSGSMDWSFMAPENDGKFEYDEYLWNLSDNVSGGTSDKLAWQSRWAGYNSLYYKPTTSYEPWPRWNKTDITEGVFGTKIINGGIIPLFDADLKTPRSNPIFKSPTLNLHSNYVDIISANAVIVDNTDGSPAYDDDFDGTTQYRTPYWKSNFRRSDSSDDWARFTPNLTAGKYSLWGYWPCENNADEKVEFKLQVGGNTVANDLVSQKANTDNTVKSGYCGEWVPLFDKTIYDLPAGTETRLYLYRKGNSRNSYTYADAVAFLPEGETEITVETIHVKNAHYYMVHDKNNDGTHKGNDGKIQRDDEVYLVNFEWADNNSDGKVEENEVSRRYFLVSYDNDSNNHEDVNGLKEVYNSADPSSDEVPDAIQPRTYDDDGNPDGFVSDIGDLQNFANWFSFYRRRELTAKAAISRTIVDLDNVYVGYNTMWRDNGGGGAKQPVLPIRVYQTIETGANDIVVDNKDSSGFSISEAWTESGGSPEWKNSSVYTEKSERWAKFTPTIPEGGQYKVAAWWNCYTDRDQKAQIKIKHKDGATTKRYNQRAKNSNTVTEGNCTDTSASSGCCGYWVPLGEYYFDQGTTGFVRIKRLGNSTGSSTTADAVRFQMQGVLNTAKVDQTNELLDVLYDINSSGSTPLRQTLQEVGQYYHKDDSSSGGIGDCPYLLTDEGGACQHAYAITMTDGFWNGSAPSLNPDNQDKDKGSPYADSYGNTLADVAMHYYDTDLAASLLNEMATNNYDKKKTQHMVTFSVSFGLDGSIKTDDINKDGVVDSPGYADDPYFLNDDTPHPTWPSISSNSATTIDDLWHASVNGRGRYFSAKEPDALVSSLQDTFSDITSRKASGASVSVNGHELSTGLILYQSSYTSGSWEGDVTAYPVDQQTGEIKKQEDDIKWYAQEMLQTQNWNTGRNIFTFDGTQGIPFRYANLSDAQKAALANNSDVVDYLRGKEILGFRERSVMLGDLVHSAPLLIDNTLFVGGNDGMLHAFNADTGAERFSYVPLRSSDYLYDLAKADYEHRYYVDGGQTFRRLKFLAGDQTQDGKDNDGDGEIDEYDENYSDYEDNDGDGDVDEAFEYRTITLLVGTLSKGGRGVYALNVSEADSISGNSDEATTATSMVMWEYPSVGTAGLVYAFVGDQTNDDVDNDGDGTVDEINENYGDGFDNDGDGTIDEEGEMVLANADGIDNDGDGTIDEAGELQPDNDPDMGYSYGTAFIARSYKSKNEGYNESNHPWVAIFANGYQSRNGQAVLFVVDALTGDLIRKISAGAPGNNGLSSPAIIDADFDGRVDFVYAGDLQGNMWKFDLKDPDPQNWGVFHGKDTFNDSTMKDKDGNFIQRIDYNDIDSSTGEHDIPKPLIHVGRPITSAPDVSYHCEEQGYLVLFGTGKFFGGNDVQDKSQQGVFGIWDFGTNPDDYLGNWTKTSSDNLLTTDSAFPSSLGENPDVKLLEQKELYWYTALGYGLRIMTDYTPQWYITDACYNGKDDDSDGEVDNESCIPFSDSAYTSDSEDNDGDEEIDESGDAAGEPAESQGHVGWFFDLPYDFGRDGLDNDGDDDIDEQDEQDALAGERVIKNILIRSGRAIFISMIPGDSPCDGGGKSILHEVDFCHGGSLDQPVFDVDDNSKVDENDLVKIGDKYYSVSGRIHDGILNVPVVVKSPPTPPSTSCDCNLDPDCENPNCEDPACESNPYCLDVTVPGSDSGDCRETKYLSSSNGNTIPVSESCKDAGSYYWKAR